MSLEEEKERLLRTLCTEDRDIREEVARYLSTEETGGIFGFFKRIKTEKDRWDSFEEVLIKFLDNPLAHNNQTQRKIINGVLDAGRMTLLATSPIFISPNPLLSHREFQYKTKMCVSERGLFVPFLSDLLFSAKRTKRYLNVIEFGEWIGYLSTPKIWDEAIDLLNKKRISDGIVIHSFIKRSVDGAIKGKNFEVLEHIMASRAEHFSRDAVKKSANEEDEDAIVFLMGKGLFSESHFEIAIPAISNHHHIRAMSHILRTFGIKPVQESITSTPHHFTEEGLSFAKTMIESGLLKEKHAQEIRTRPFRGTL